MRTECEVGRSTGLRYSGGGTSHVATDCKSDNSSRHDKTETGMSLQIREERNAAVAPFDPRSDTDFGTFFRDSDSCAAIFGRHDVREERERHGKRFSRFQSGVRAVAIQQRNMSFRMLGDRIEIVPTASHRTNIAFWLKSTCLCAPHFMG